MAGRGHTSYRFKAVYVHPIWGMLGYDVSQVRFFHKKMTLTFPVNYRSQFN